MQAIEDGIGGKKGEGGREAAEGGGHNAAKRNTTTSTTTPSLPHVPEPDGSQAHGIGEGATNTRTTRRMDGGMGEEEVGLGNRPEPNLPQQTLGKKGRRRFRSTSHTTPLTHTHEQTRVERVKIPTKRSKGQEGKKANFSHAQGNHQKRPPTSVVKSEPLYFLYFFSREEPMPMLSTLETMYLLLWATHASPSAWF